MGSARRLTSDDHALRPGSLLSTHLARLANYGVLTALP